MPNRAIPTRYLPYLAPPAALRARFEEWLALTAEIGRQIGAGDDLPRWQIAGQAATQQLLEATAQMATRH